MKKEIGEFESKFREKSRNTYFQYHLGNLNGYAILRNGDSKLFAVIKVSRECQEEFLCNFWAEEKVFA